MGKKEIKDDNIKKHLKQLTRKELENVVTEYCRGYLCTIRNWQFETKS